MDIFFLNMLSNRHQWNNQGSRQQPEKIPINTDTDSDSRCCHLFAHAYYISQARNNYCGYFPMAPCPFPPDSIECTLLHCSIHTIDFCPLAMSNIIMSSNHNIYSLPFQLILNIISDLSCP